MVGARVPRARRRCEMKSGWVTKKLGEVCEINYGTRVRRKDSRSDNYPVYGGGGETFRWEIFNRENQCVVSRFAMSPECVRFVSGKFFLNDSGLTVDAASDGLLQDYLDWCLFGKQDIIYALGKGSAQKNLDIREFVNIPIPIPPLAEQKRIVAKIDAAFEKIDKLKANAEKNLANAKELFQSALDEAMRPKDGWVEKRLGEVCKTTSGGTPIKSHREYYEDGNIPWLRSGEVCCKDIIKSEMFITELGLRNSSAKIMPKNTVLIAMYGATAAQAGILRFESATNQAICGILPNKYFEPEFLYYYFRTIQRQLAARAQGGAQPNISQEKIKDTLVPILPLSEQREIVKHLDLLAEKIKILEQNYTKQIADCVEMRQAVLREAFEGRL